MRSREIRQTYVDYFVKNGHLHLPSSSLVPPSGDKTVLLTTAGMQQMTPFFLGVQTPPHRRLTTVQKCFRTVDIDEVGDPSHLTFFEMLGNFSVGEYFKEGAVSFAWELLTQVFKLPEDKLYPSIFPTDEEALELWTKMIGLPASRITRIEDNWWGPVGKTGPCGPDSEIYYDLGPEFDPDPDARVGDSPRYLEIWNLVFMQFNRDTHGVDTPLPRKNIDTGMGLERLSLVLQGVSSIYSTDLFQPIIQRAADITGKRYGANEKDDISLRVIADHSRAATMLITDGVLPGNVDRGYILRRILRRAIRYGRLLGQDKPFMHHTSQVVMDMLGDIYPEIIERKNHVFAVLADEEEKFGHTLQMGLNRFEILIENNPLDTKIVSGEDVFDLLATHGFPPDLTRELAEERGFEIDWEGFERAKQKHSEASTNPDRWKVARVDLEDYKALGLQKTPFKGYETTSLETEVLAVLVNGKRVKSADAGQDAEIVLAQTPFYVESGGQISDTGYIETEFGRIEIENTYKPVGDVVAHQGKVVEGFIGEGQKARAVVDEVRRLDTARNHTGTHILHQALKDVLGNNVGQAGSLVSPERLRFDFTFPNQVTAEQLVQVEQIVNDKIRASLPVTVNVLPIDEAKKSGAVMMFGEKYGEVVRILSVGDYSKEFCGGTHLQNSGQIGLLLISNEGSVGSGLRRIEAVTGRGAEKYIGERLQLVDKLASVLQARPEQLVDEAIELKRKLRDTERELALLQQKQALAESSELLKSVVEVEGVRVLSAKVNAPNADVLRSIGDKLRDSLKSGVVAIGAVIKEKPSLLVMVTPDLVERGLNAGKIIAPIAEKVGGRAGGRPNMAQGGGNDPEKLDEALSLTIGLVRGTIK
ncbi:MAG: alanine--tRNA ligase [Chloroflexi bacterium]|uniref:Alanine--tRNA ligase n=1 Tax=Candidatus Chlorohelix allophototropha TaxID=3003348 RepID=A0A8T7M138_9CHLR|nr:alanine--tRNA ligase [Chloroflexota bacterium]WJW66210.1 alanine--tRNA ligase [Chloroflexota bacterium L227-S17]